MKKAFHIFLLAVLLGMTAACVEELPQPGPVTLRPSEMELLFTSGPSSAVTVSTKSDMGEVEENTVHNLYVFVFDGNGQKVFGYLFDNNYHYPSQAEGQASGQNNWWTTGLIHLSAALPVDDVTGQSTCTLVGIANVDDDRMGVSAESLGLVRNLDDLSETATRWVEYDQKTVFRSGYFLMCDSLNNVVLNKNDNDVFVAQSNKKLQLERLDAKVSFYVQVLPSNPGEPVVASFTPLKWQVFNVPSRSYLLPHNPPDKSQSAEDFFDTAEMNFETDSVPTTTNYIKGHPEYLKYGFTFYMLENRPDPKVTKDNWTYADRETRGADSTFLYANDLATYVVLTGRLQMEAEQQNATLGADVSYLIHLGNFGADLSDFSVERNHHYKYTIYIRNAEDIRLQAEGYPIIHPGASGHVLVARNELYTCDAHYASHVFTLKGEMLKDLIQDASWYVETPFGAGSPDPDNSAINQLDYKWVEFRVNTPDGNGGYTANRAQYQPHVDNPTASKTMYINELIAYLKEEMTKRANGTANAFTGGDSINITAFVNEFYYTSHPISGAADPRSLWKQFVNKPMRRMCMLAGSASDAIKTNAGSESFGTVFTIQQKSIQTVYNINHDELYSAWGCEHLEEEDEHHAPSSSVGHVYTNNPQNVNRNNTSMWNGRENSFRIWDWRWEDVTLDGATHTHIYPDLSGGSSALKWEDYLNLSAKNGEPLMKSSYQYVRYECMSRNRDNDGDGYIDKDEVQWYMGATNQLIGIYLGWHSIEGAARLYQRDAEDKASSNEWDWRQRVLSSTRDESNSSNTNSDKYPRVMWAEQGINGSNPTYANNDKNFSSRCLRNLGAYDNQDITYADTSIVPQPYLTVHRKNTQTSGDYDEAFNNYVYYEFDCSNMNTASLRAYTDNELVLHDENSEASFLYTHFVSAPLSQQPTFTAITNKNMNNYLDTYGINPYCPEGYRLPNVRELAVYRNLIPDSDKTLVFNNDKVYAFTRSYWSLGSDGLRKVTNEYGWGANKQKILMTYDHTTTSVRCVKDVR